MSIATMTTTNRTQTHKCVVLCDRFVNLLHFQFGLWCSRSQLIWIKIKLTNFLCARATTITVNKLPQIRSIECILQIGFFFSRFEFGESSQWQCSVKCLHSVGSNSHQFFAFFFRRRRSNKFSNDNRKWCQPLFFGGGFSSCRHNQNEETKKPNESSSTGCSVWHGFMIMIV